MKTNSAVFRGAVSVVRRVLVYLAAVVMAAGVVIAFLIALYPGFVITKDVQSRRVWPSGVSCVGPVHPHCEPAYRRGQSGVSTRIPVPSNSSRSLSCSQRGTGSVEYRALPAVTRGSSTTTEPMVCTPSR